MTFTFVVLVTMAVSVRRACEEMHGALCDCQVESASAIVIPFPTPASPSSLPASA